MTGPTGPPGASDFGVPPETSLAIQRNPQSTEVVRIAELQVKLYARRIERANVKHHWVVVGEDPQGAIDFAIKVPADSHDDLESMTPFQMLELAVQKAGADLIFDGATTRMVRSREFEIRGRTPDQILEPLYKPGLDAILRMYMKGDQRTGRGLCALAFAIDLDKYREWTRGT